MPWGLQPLSCFTEFQPTHTCRQTQVQRTEAYTQQSCMHTFHAKTASSPLCTRANGNTATHFFHCPGTLPKLGKRTKPLSTTDAKPACLGGGDGGASTSTCRASTSSARRAPGLGDTQLAWAAAISAPATDETHAGMRPHGRPIYQVRQGVNTSRAAVSWPWQPPSPLAAVALSASRLSGAWRATSDQPSYFTSLAKGFATSCAARSSWQSPSRTAAAAPAPY